MHALTTRQWIVLALLTLVWGFNWPVMKVGVTGFPPLTYRMLALLIGTPVLGLGSIGLKGAIQSTQTVLERASDIVGFQHVFLACPDHHSRQSFVQRDAPPFWVTPCPFSRPSLALLFSRRNCQSAIGLA
jgi:hypothetical protein